MDFLEIRDERVEPRSGLTESIINVVERYIDLIGHAVEIMLVT